MLRPDRGGKGGKIRHELVNIVRIVLNRDQPLLDLAPWRQEDAAVVLEQPVGIDVRIVDAEKLRKSRTGSVEKTTQPFAPTATTRAGSPLRLISRCIPSTARSRRAASRR